mgnify:CR=1 FL=1
MHDSNAGAYKYDIAGAVKTVTLLNEKCEVVTFNREQMDVSFTIKYILAGPPTLYVVCL